MTPVIPSAERAGARNAAALRYRVQIYYLAS